MASVTESVLPHAFILGFFLSLVVKRFLGLSLRHSEIYFQEQGGFICAFYVKRFILRCFVDLFLGVLQISPQKFCRFVLRSAVEIFDKKYLPSSYCLYHWLYTYEVISRNGTLKGQDLFLVAITDKCIVLYASHPTRTILFYEPLLDFIRY